MKKLFIYYSNTGSGDKVAEAFAEKGYELRKVTPKRPLPKKFFFMVMTGGLLAGLGVKSKLVGFDGDVSEFDEVVVGSPIWNGRLSCPMNTVLAKTDLGGKKLSFALWAGGGEAPKAIEKLKKAYPSAKVVIMKEPKKYPEELKKTETL